MRMSAKAVKTWFLGMGVLTLGLCGVLMYGCAQTGETAAVPTSQTEAANEQGEKAEDTDNATAKRPAQKADAQKESNDSAAVPGEDVVKGDTPSTAAAEAKAVPVNNAKTPNVAIANLGMSVLRELDTADENIMISPFSLSAALGLTANGAEGETRTELENALGLPVDKLNEAFAGYEALSDVVELSYYDAYGAESTYKQQVFSNANSLWLGQGLQPKQSFLDLAAADYNAEVQMVDGANDAEAINDWVNTHTNEMIPTIVEDGFQVDPQGLALINAVAFECVWAAPYIDEQVESGTFTSSEGEKQEAQFLHGTEYAYLESSDVTGFVKDYKDRRFAFAALLPTEGTTPEELLDEMSGEGLCKLLKDSNTHQEVKTVMPEFESTFEATLNDALQALGITSAFEVQDANFSGITDDPLWIDKVLQKTYVSVDRIGTKAAAVTAELACGAAPIEEPPPTVCLDRPFVYVIFETESTTPLFIGVVNSLE